MEEKTNDLRFNSAQKLLDSLPYRAVVIDENGVIKRTNEKWEKFARRNNLSLEECGAGINYVDVSEGAKGEDSDKSSRTAAGIKEVLNKEQDEYSVEYPCHSPDKRYWFKMRAVAYEDGALILHEDITERKLFEERLARSNKRLNDEFNKAKNLHESMLPETYPDFSGMNLAIYYEHAHKLGGDFYNFMEIGEQIIFYISDVSGHDLSSSMVNVFLKEAMNSFARAPGCLSGQISEPINPANIARYIKENFQDFGLPADYFISLIVGVIDKTSQEISLCNMGVHLLPKVIRNGKVHSVSSIGMPITSLEDIDYEYNVSRINLTQCDVLFVSTDGLLEQESEKGNEIFGEERLTEILEANYDKSPEEIISVINRRLESFRGEKPLQDDLTYLILQCEKNM